jgi:hypothetical protein
MLAASPPPPPLTAWPTVPITDGRSYAVWSAAPPYLPYVDTAAVRVLHDDQPAALDAAATMTAPPRCKLDAASTAAIGYWCNDADPPALPDREWPVLQDPATGATTVPPGVAAFANETGSNRANGEDWSLTALGTVAAELQAGGNRVSVDQVRSLDGTLLHRVSDDPRRVLSLDAPGGSVALCAPLALPDDAERRTAQYRPPWLLSVRDGRLRLRHCASRRVRTLDTHITWLGTAVLTARYAAWSEPGRVHYRRLGATTRTATFRSKQLLPHSSDRYPLLMAGTDHRLWLGAGRTAVMMAP